jgi:RTX calcium-binding nonapeptide repeat (4 copies)
MTPEYAAAKMDATQRTNDPCAEQAAGKEGNEEGCDLRSFCGGVPDPRGRDRVGGDGAMPLGGAECLGTGGPDTMYGTARHDLMRGLGGDDEMFGREGPDRTVEHRFVGGLYGGPGSDVLHGGEDGTGLSAIAAPTASAAARGTTSSSAKIC